jgi:signal transduction histidine kinase
VLGKRSFGRSVRATRQYVARSAQSTLEAHRFESLVDELSAAMAYATGDAVDREIETWLEKICVALDLDRSAVYERDAPDKDVRVTHTWVRPKFPPFPKNFDPEGPTKSSTDWVMRGNRLVWSRPEEIPPKHEDVRKFVDRYGPKASALFPLWAGNRVIGGASFGRFRGARKWDPEVLHQLELAVRIFAHAIERKQAEAAARLAQEELALTQRRSIVAELIGSLAHELNQPLGAIMSNLGGLARLVSRGNSNPALALQAINNAMEDTRRASEIMRRVRSMFKGNQTEKVALNLGDLANDVVRMVAKEAVERDVAIRVDIQDSIPGIMGDQVLLQQCVLNLLMNALEACVEGKSEQKRITIGIARENSRAIVLSVSDNGPGIDESVAGRLFEPFVTTKGNGMGLGLLVTRSIVEQHGGKIDCESNADGGTDFILMLPIAEVKPRLSRARRDRGKRVNR